MNKGCVNFIVKKEGSINIGVVGVGHLGNFHLKQLGGVPQVSISGLYDSNPKRAEEMSLLHNVHSYSSLDEILDKSDAVSIVIPTSKHYYVADKALNKEYKGLTGNLVKEAFDWDDSFMRKNSTIH